MLHVRGECCVLRYSACITFRLFSSMLSYMQVSHSLPLLLPSSVQVLQFNTFFFCLYASCTILSYRVALAINVSEKKETMCFEVKFNRIEKECHLSSALENAQELPFKLSLKVSIHCLLLNTGILQMSSSKMNFFKNCI